MTKNSTVVGRYLLATVLFFCYAVRNPAAKANAKTVFFAINVYHNTLSLCCYEM